MQFVRERDSIELVRSWKHFGMWNLHCLSDISETVNKAKLNAKFFSGQGCKVSKILSKIHNYSLSGTDDTHFKKTLVQSPQSLKNICCFYFLKDLVILCSLNKMKHLKTKNQGDWMTLKNIPASNLLLRNSYKFMSKKKVLLKIYSISFLNNFSLFK
jgi:hypothetical protein